jgi:hypothetical protein
LLLVLVACLPQLARAFLGRTPLLNILYNVNIWLEFLLLFVFFRRSFSSRRRNLLFNILTFICVGAGITSLLVFGIYSKFLTEWLCINNLTYTAWILLLMYDLYDTEKDLSEVSASFLLYLVGLFFYSGCTLLIFSLWQYIVAHQNSFLRNLWIIHDVFNIFMYTFFTIGFYLEIKAHYSNKTT